MTDHFIRKGVTLPLSQMREVDLFAKAIYVGYDAEAIRFLTARGLKIKNPSPQRSYAQEETTRKTLLFTKEQWKEIEDFRFSHRIKTEVDTIRYLIDLGLAFEKQLGVFLLTEEK